MPSKRALTVMLAVAMTVHARVRIGSSTRPLSGTFMIAVPDAITTIPAKTTLGPARYAPLEGWFPEPVEARRAVPAVRPG